MNPRFLGDSYDIVKRFFCRELAGLGYEVAVDPLFTGDWSGRETDFHRLVLAKHRNEFSRDAARTALLLDPDTGVWAKAADKQHVSFERICEEVATHDLVFAFDQSFLRGAPKSAMHQKLLILRERGLSAMYYDSHARFLFASQRQEHLDEILTRFISLGLPASRFIHAGA
jgi:hypothetical protein